MARGKRAAADPPYSPPAKRRAGGGGRGKKVVSKAYIEEEADDSESVVIVGQANGRATRAAARRSSLPPRVGTVEPPETSTPETDEPETPETATATATQTPETTETIPDEDDGTGILGHSSSRAARTAKSAGMAKTKAIGVKTPKQAKAPAATAGPKPKAQLAGAALKSQRAKAAKEAKAEDKNEQHTLAAGLDGGERGKAKARKAPAKKRQLPSPPVVLMPSSEAHVDESPPTHSPADTPTDAPAETPAETVLSPPPPSSAHRSTANGNAETAAPSAESSRSVRLSVRNTARQAESSQSATRSPDEPHVASPKPPAQPKRPAARKGKGRARPAEEAVESDDSGEDEVDPTLKPRTENWLREVIPDTPPPAPVLDHTPGRTAYSFQDAIDSSTLPPPSPSQNSPAESVESMLGGSDSAPAVSQQPAPGPSEQPTVNGGAVHTSPTALLDLPYAGVTSAAGQAQASLPSALTDPRAPPLPTAQEPPPGQRPRHPLADLLHPLPPSSAGAASASGQRDPSGSPAPTPSKQPQIPAPSQPFPPGHPIAVAAAKEQTPLPSLSTVVPPAATPRTAAAESFFRGSPASHRYDPARNAYVPNGAPGYPLPPLAAGSSQELAPYYPASSFSNPETPKNFIINNYYNTPPPSEQLQSQWEMGSRFMNGQEAGPSNYWWTEPRNPQAGPSGHSNWDYESPLRPNGYGQAGPGINGRGLVENGHSYANGFSEDPHTPHARPDRAQPRAPKHARYSYPMDPPPLPHRRSYEMPEVTVASVAGSVLDMPVSRLRPSVHYPSSTPDFMSKNPFQARSAERGTSASTSDDEPTSVDGVIPEPIDLADLVNGCEYDKYIASGMRHEHQELRAKWEKDVSELADNSAKEIAAIEKTIEQEIAKIKQKHQPRLDAIKEHKEAKTALLNTQYAKAVKKHNAEVRARAEQIQLEDKKRKAQTDVEEEDREDLAELLRYLNTQVSWDRGGINSFDDLKKDPYIDAKSTLFYKYKYIIEADNPRLARLMMGRSLRRLLDDERDMSGRAHRSISEVMGDSDDDGEQEARAKAAAAEATVKKAKNAAKNKKRR